MEDYSEELQRIAELSDPEQQGYEVAPIIAQATGVTPEGLLRGLLNSDNSCGVESDVSRNIGVVRWCLDQRGGDGRPL